MRILMFSWEYPPHVVGGLGKHVAELLQPLGDLSELELHLVTPRWSGGESLERVGQAMVHRVEPPITEGDFYTGAWQTNLRLEEYARRLWQEARPLPSSTENILPLTSIYPLLQLQRVPR